MSKEPSFSGFLWSLAWIFQALVWFLIIFFAVHYLTVEVPETRSYYDAGIENGFDGLAGIIASAAPSWDRVSQIKGQGSGLHLSKLQGDASFKSWLGKGEYFSWNAGLGTLTYDAEGNLLWVRRIAKLNQSGPFVRNLVSGELFPVVEAPKNINDAGRPAQPPASAAEATPAINAGATTETKP